MDGITRYYPDPFSSFGANDSLKPCRRRQAKPKRSLYPEEGQFAPLVEKDGLFFRIATSGENSPRLATLPPSLRPPASGMGAVFHRAFLRVWTAVPEEDQQLFLDYWRRDRFGLFRRDLDYIGLPQPVIQIEPGTPHDLYNWICQHAGMVLRFPTSLVRASEHTLAYTIARTLAQVHLHANGDHLRLSWELLEEPFTRWERQQGTRTTEAMRDRKWRTLQKEYLAKTGSLIAQFLTRCGWEEEPPLQER